MSDEEGSVTIHNSSLVTRNFPLILLNSHIVLASWAEGGDNPRALVVQGDLCRAADTCDGYVLAYQGRVEHITRRQVFVGDSDTGSWIVIGLLRAVLQGGTIVYVEELVGCIYIGYTSAGPYQEADIVKPNTSVDSRRILVQFASAKSLIGNTERLGGLSEHQRSGSKCDYNSKTYDK